MKLLAKLTMAQRIVIVVALGVVIMLLGYWIAFHDVSSFGWVAYAPLSAATSSPIHRSGLAFGWDVLIWAGLTVAWAALSMVVLRQPKSE